MTPIILAVNPGSTSTKVALYAGETLLSAYEIERKYKGGLRGAALQAEIDDYVRELQEFLGQSPHRPDAVVGRGGFICREGGRIDGGAWLVAEVDDGQVRVCEDLLTAMLQHCELDHASNLGIPIAARLAAVYGIPAFTVDPVVSDDFCAEARFSGYAAIERRSCAHALSVKRLAVKAARQLRRPVEDLSMVVAHLGGGTTVAAVKGGRMIDNNIALLGNGPFTPQRVGSLPMKSLIDLCYSGRFTHKELEAELTRNGGWKSYLGTDSGLELERRLAAGDPQVRQVLEAMAYQIAKEIGAMAVAAGLPIDALVFSGGLTRFTPLLDMVRRRVGSLCSVQFFYPDSVEMEAMAGGVLAVLDGRVQPRRFQLPPHLRVQSPLIS